MSTIKELVTRGSNSIFRRVSIKRLQINNQYEPDWGDITSYVIKFGTIRSSYNDITFLGNTNVTGATLKLDNSRGQFNDENTITSLFNGFKTRYRTKFKIEVGYLDDEQNEVEGLVFYGILYGDPTTNDNGTINIKLSSLLKVFSNYAAEGIATGAGTTEDLIDRLVKKTQGGVRIFDNFFEGATDADKYKINPRGITGLLNINNPEIDDDASVFDKLKDYSLIDDFYFGVDNLGAFVWDEKLEKNVISWYFNGPGITDNDFGVNIVTLPKLIQGLNNTWGRAAIEYSNGTAVSAAAWTPNDGSPQDLYGERTFNYTLKELSVSEASAMALKIRQIYQNPKREYTIKTTFIPHLELNDWVKINYLGEPTAGEKIIIGDFVIGDTSIPIGGSQGSINIRDKDAKIISITLNLDNLTSQFVLREF